MKIDQLAVLLLIGFVGSVFAEIEPPGIVVDGFNAYYRNGGSAALDVWLKGSVVDKGVFADCFAAIEKGYGRMIGFETISVAPVSGSLQRVYMLMKFEKGPAFLKFDCYKPDTNWIISRMNCNTDPAVILPERLLLGGRK